MVVAAFPLAKIGLLLMKQLSKPLATIIKNEAKKHPIIRKKIVIPIGKGYRWIENQAAHLRGEKPEPLSEEEAVELGANAIGEIALFGILTVILLAEISRQGDKKAEIQKIKDDELSNMKDLVLEAVADISRIQKTLVKLKEEINVASDAFEAEEIAHQEYYDFDFLDVLAQRKKKFRRNKKMDDEISPPW